MDQRGDSLGLGQAAYDQSIHRCGANRWHVASPRTDRILRRQSRSDRSPIAANRLVNTRVWNWMVVAIECDLGCHLVGREIRDSHREDVAGQQLTARLTAQSVLDFPLFIYTLFGGLAVRRITESFDLGHVIDEQTINRLTSTAMDVLVVAAIASLNLVATKALLVPFLVLLCGGAIWTGICLLVLARRILPTQHWFQLGLINYGMSTGTTATGFVLLRVIDPELESGAAEDYAMAAPLSSPFIGGGILTVALPLVVLQQVPIAASALAMIVIVGILIVIGVRWQQKPDRNA